MGEKCEEIEQPLNKYDGCNAHKKIKQLTKSQNSRHNMKAITLFWVTMKNKEFGKVK